ncbi:KilA-N domain-containing protein [Lonepinella sp. BR2474]|uniref:KilA-N domain-containing protein n=1 Tax=Lonepinella sp. BR2474 TaxID=3434548 RepID=UPI003F6DB8A9
MTTQLAILNNSIRQLDNLYSLTDLHKASGGDEKHKPALFLRLEQTQNLISEIENDKVQICTMAVKTIRGGKNPSTYACEELILAYATWISPKFHLVVLRAFIAMHRGEQTAVKIAPLSKQHQQNIKELVMGRAKSLPKDQQARATITQWSALKTHFGKSYKDINDDQYLEAISLLARLPLDGELLLDQPQAPQTGIVLTPDELALLLRLWSSSTNLHESGHHLLRRLNGLLVGREVNSLQFNVRLHTELLKAIHPLIERLMPQVQQPPKTLLLGHAKH